MLTKGLSRFVLALVVGGSAVFFAACGADENKAPELNDAIAGYEFRKAYQGLRIVSKDDDTIIEDVVVSGRDGECSLDKEVLIVGSDRTISKDELKSEKIRYGDTVRVYFADKCERKNGALQIKIKTNFGTYTYENKDDKTTLK